MITIDEMLSITLAHLAINIEYYKGFYSSEVLKDMKSYIKLGSYNENVVDIITVPTAHVLHLNLSVWQKVTSGNI